ncbi:MAG: single-stranded DNA-binding protein, partial [Blautia hansenii]
AESKNAQNHAAGQAAAGKPQVDPDGFMNIPDGIDEELPFS